MRVGIDARLLYYQQGGISTYTRCLINGLADVRQEEQYAVLQSRKDSRRVIDQAGFSVFQLWTPCHNRLEQLTLALELIPLGLDVLHSPDFIPPLRRRCKSVITVHDLAFLRYPELLTPASRRYYGQITKAVLTADAIIAVSRCTANDLVDLLGVAKENVTVIHEAADPCFHPLNDKAELARVAEKYHLPSRFVLFVGTVEPRKNLPTLLKAFAAVVRASETAGPGGQVRLVVAGSKGWLSDEVHERLDELDTGRGQFVDYIGPVAEDDLPSLYNLAALLALPSLYEGFGLTVLEAMACGTPVVASSTSSLPEVAGDAALLVEPTDIAGWMQAIARVLDDESLRQDLSARGLARATQFSWRKVAEETRRVYLRVAARV